MKSRYSAYAAGEAEYIIRTTHPENPDYGTDRKGWREEILDFCRSVEFLRLEILSHTSGEGEGWVRFVAHLSAGPMEECSRFLREERWLYHSASDLPYPSDSGDSREFE
jgi:SEC-C motif-containing protein